eukprot:CAMPEP_0169300402 /NCGR_PEP_ID=MMETSP1016-20121227/67609_1 /TAXON_ID=342587 /ORGANISM="Karlodinium micrum, Strain CCMP2283" /LENGTH=290 /DNA_ID=CAMNT_0009392767 /DNA_START=52 /DNA_END=925 /DNA_ORIENTATION=-
MTLQAVAPLEPNLHGEMLLDMQQLRRSGSVCAGCVADIIMNYPLWIIAKRKGVGIAPLPPTLPEVYKGSGSLMFSSYDDVEDIGKRQFERMLPPSISLGVTLDRELLSSVMGGAFAAATFCAQVEHVITASHALKMSMPATAAHLYHHRGGVKGLLLPPGTAAMMGREMPFGAALFYVRPTVTKMVYGASGSGHASDDGASHVAKRFHLEFISGFLTAALTCPFSHVPSVIAAYQQGHGVSLRRACSDIYGQGGLRAFWRGLFARTCSIAGTMIVVPIVIDALGGKAHGG